MRLDDRGVGASEGDATTATLEDTADDAHAALRLLRAQPVVDARRIGLIGHSYGGEVAPADIWVREGETPFKPGPIVGELQKAGVPAAIEKGKVVVKKDKLLVKSGDRIPRDVASALTRLEILPLIVGLDLRTAYEGGQLYGRDALAVDDVKVRADMVAAIRGAIGLSLSAGYPTKFTIPLLIGKAHRGAVGVAVAAGFPTKETVWPAAA